jgi:hypothetical protein
MNLREKAESISCDHNNYLDEKYNLYNDYLFRKSLYCKSKDGAVHFSKNPENLSHLKFSFIDKKNCIFNPPPTDLKNLENNPYNPQGREFPVMFNINTRIKTAVHNK